jgi:hypothetical protein
MSLPLLSGIHWSKFPHSVVYVVQYIHDWSCNLRAQNNNDRYRYTYLGKLLHANGPISFLMQYHVRFLMMLRRESEERERGRCSTKQPPHEWNNHSTKKLHNHCMSCCFHATHNIPVLHTQIKKFYYSTRRLIWQLIVQVLCWVDPYYMASTLVLSDKSSHALARNIGST